MNYNFNVEIATRIGVDEAIMLNNFVYWLAKNKALKASLRISHASSYSC